MSRLLAALVSWPCALMVAVVKGYRFLLKPWLGNACRFEPTCSQYALTALQTHGALAGGTLAAARLMRCHPWCHGGCDEVPAHPPALFTRLGWPSAQACTPQSPAQPVADAPRGTYSESSPLPVQEPAP